MEEKLLELYKQIFEGKQNRPVWAVHKTTPGLDHELIHCPIPFVGQSYDRQETNLLLYASAENLSSYNARKKDYLDCDDYAINRHRNSFHESVSNPDTFFPNVHIQPVNDGCLAIAALYIYLKFQNFDKRCPAEFLENIALANYCKYSIQSSSARSGGRNQDYAGNPDYLAESHAYIEHDIKILKPDYIIMPKTIYWTDRDFIDRIRGNARIIPIYQINARNINLRIGEKYPKRAMQELDPIVKEWYEHLTGSGITGKTKENFLSIFSYIDDVLQNKII